MNRKNIALIVMKLYLYADMCKMIHYSTKKMHAHKQADAIRDIIMEFADSLAEQSFGFTGRPNFNDFSLRVSIKKTNDLSQLCQNVFDLVDSLRAEAEKNGRYSSIVSLIDDFKGDLANNTYLNFFDGVSQKSLHEAVNKTIKEYIK